MRRKPKTIGDYRNLLNFLPQSVLVGQRPSVWWTRNHDIDLLVGTFRHGYANYQAMKENQNLGFEDLEKNSMF